MTFVDMEQNLPISTNMKYRCNGICLHLVPRLHTTVDRQCSSMPWLTTDYLSAPRKTLAWLTHKLIALSKAVSIVVYIAGELQLAATGYIVC